MQRPLLVVVLLCVAQTTLGQDFDCRTDAGQLAFLQNGARTDPDCYNLIINRILSGIYGTQFYSN